MSYLAEAALLLFPLIAGADEARETKRDRRFPETCLVGSCGGTFKRWGQNAFRK